MKKSVVEQVETALLKRGSRYKFKEMCALAKCSGPELEVAVAELRKKYPNLTYAKFDRTFYLSDVPTWYSDRTDLSLMPKEGVFGLVSDTHLCSVAERLDILKIAYDAFEKAGVKQVFHTGDLSDGSCSYPGHQNFVKVFGSQAQAVYVIKHYPHRDGITTYCIGGNHDLDNYHRDKVDRLSLVTHGFKHEGKEYAGREDIVYLGQYSHTIVLPEQVTMHLLHPRGSNPYALSYKQQKRSEAMDRNLRPDIEVSGHLHVWNYCHLQGSHFLALPGLQDETEFFVRLGLPRSVGFVLCYYGIKKGRLTYLRPELHMFA